MGAFDAEAFDNFVLDHNVPGFFANPVELKSGRQSHWYVNWRKPTGDVWLLKKVELFVRDFVEAQGLNPDCFYGVPEGATKLAIAAQLACAERSEKYGEGSHVIPMGRGKPKDHGRPEDKYFVTAPRGRVIVLEDVTTTGGSLLSTIADIKELKGVEIIAAISLTNRMELTPIRGKDSEKVYDAFARTFHRATEQQYGNNGMPVASAVAMAGVPLLTLSTAERLLPRAYAKMQPGVDIGRAVEREFADHGVQTIQVVK